ncbi:hypothetical protein GQ53DRAFT_757457 [Thozetella sp. PMI_491]|nr:hypothetical protein GQ53DRAFT_757457 [Thozetella sp. PMI_491]
MAFHDSSWFSARAFSSTGFPDSTTFGSGSSTTTGSGYSSSQGCQLTPAASAFSAMLSALIGSIINGLTSGWLVAFATGWIAWMAVFRVLLSGTYLMYRSLTNSWGSPAKKEEAPPPYPGYSGHGEATNHLMADFNATMGSYGLTPTSIRSSRGILAPLWPQAETVRATDRASLMRRGPITRFWADLNQDVTILGWFSWVYCALWAPITQTIWVAANASNHNVGAAKLVKGLTTAVTALPICIDCKVRYADSLKSGGRVFNFVTATSCLLQGVLGLVLLATGVADVMKDTSVTILPIVVIYPLFCIVWMIGSLFLVPMRDGGRRRASQWHWVGYFMDVGMGAFAGIFLAAPAFILYQSAQFSKGFGAHGNGLDDLGAYLSCEAALWRKFSAVTP